MPNQFDGTGNLADAPSIKNCSTSSGKKFRVADMRVFFDEFGKDASGNFEQTGGFWLPVTAYDLTADQCARLLKKGTRVKVSGQLSQFKAHDDQGNPVLAFQVKASSVALSLSRVDAVEFSPPKDRAGGRPMRDAEPADFAEPDYMEMDQ